MEILCEMKAELGVEVQGRLHVERNGTAIEHIVQRERCMNRPIRGTRCAFDGATPLNQPTLLPNVDFLPAANQADHHAPFGNPFGELDEVLWLRLVDRAVAFMLQLDHLRVERAMGFVEDEYVFRRHEARFRGMDGRLR